MKIKVTGNIGKGHEGHNTHSPKGISPSLRASWGQSVGSSVLVIPKTLLLYYCHECDTIYLWKNNVLNVVGKKSYLISIMQNDTKMVNIHLVKNVKRKQPKNLF